MIADFEKIQQAKQALLIVVAASSMVALSPSAMAFACTGQVKNLVASPNGQISMSLYNPEGTAIWEYLVLCAVTTSVNGVEPAACKTIYAHLALAATTGRKVTFWIDGSNWTPNCQPSRFPAWGYLPTGNLGWYYGPSFDGN